MSPAGRGRFQERFTAQTNQVTAHNRFPISSELVFDGLGNAESSRAP
jgi:hypothetical protein